LALRLLPPLAALCNRIGVRSRHLGGALAAWQISRRPKAQAGATLLLFLAVAAGTFAFCGRSTWQRSLADQGTFTAGAPVRLDIQDSGAVDGTVSALAADPSVQSVTPVIRTSASDGGTALAMDTSTAPANVLLAAGQYSAPPNTLWRALREGTPNIPTLPSHAAQLRTSRSTSARIERTMRGRPVRLGRDLSARRCAIVSQDHAGPPGPQMLRS
jgi:hypothetical protein